MENMIFCRIAWMEYYQGEIETDQPIGGGEYVDTHGYGHEIYNYKPDDKGNLFGFVEVPAGRNLAIERLGADYLSNSIAPITIVWCARSPDDDQLYIIGWYKNATVFRSYQDCPDNLIGKRNLPYKRDKWSYIFMAELENSILLPISKRRFEIPPKGSDSWGFGRSNVWYASDERDVKFKKAVIKYLTSTEKQLVEVEKEGVKKNVKKFARVPHYQHDIEKRHQIEVAAMEAVENYYHKDGWVTIDVSAQNKGWDIEVIKGKEMLAIEVKGLSGSNVGFELTPREYEQMKLLSPKKIYRVCVLTEALTDTSKLFHFLYDRGSSSLISINRELKLRIEDRVAAKVISA